MDGVDAAPSILTCGAGLYFPFFDVDGLISA
jgi:hypothetical protein